MVITQNLKPEYIVLPLLVICAVVSNYYSRDFYINYNSAVYNFVKYSMQTGLETGDIKRIHIFGIISPLNADVYSRFVAETALKDLGEEISNYQLTFSRNKNFLARMEEADYLRVREQLSENDKQTLDNLYAFDPTYRQYYIKASPSQDDQKKLHRFEPAGWPRELRPQRTRSRTKL